MRFVQSENVDQDLVLNTKQMSLFSQKGVTPIKFKLRLKPEFWQQMITKTGDIGAGHEVLSM